MFRFPLALFLPGRFVFFRIPTLLRLVLDNVYMGLFSDATRFPQRPLPLKIHDLPGLSSLFQFALLDQSLL